MKLKRAFDVPLWKQLREIRSLDWWDQHRFRILVDHETITILSLQTNDYQLTYDQQEQIKFVLKGLKDEK